MNLYSKTLAHTHYCNLHHTYHNLLRKKIGKNLVIHNYAGHDFPDLKDYKLVIHCGACMTNRREVLSRILIASQNGVPITNYGVVISYCLGILPRATKIFSPKV